MKGSPFIQYGKQKIALTCGICEYGPNTLDEKNRRCLMCMTGKKKGFKLPPQFRGKQVLEGEEREDND